jgi:serine/threonine protein kinase/Tol biopolymer transport system component
LSEDISAQLTEFRVGSLLAGYRLEQEVGAGGMAVVFRARDERLGRPVALKILAPTLASDSAFRRRFIAESQAAAAVDDPHIIPVYEAGEAGGVLFIAMRYVAGGDLRQVLQAEGTLPPDQAADFVSQVASALDAAHGAGLVHRDVKPGNILVDTRPGRPDHVYLSDFGIVRRATAERLTQVGSQVGTPEYMAPEQISGQDVDGRADQYSLACVTFQLLTGALPFKRDQLPALIYAHLSAPPPSLVSLRPDLPAAVDQVVAKAMAKTPEKRYSSCGDFADALREALGLASYRRRSPATAPPTPPPSGTAETPEAAVGDGPVTVTGAPSRPAATADIPADAPDLLAPGQGDNDGGTASPAAAAVADSQRTGDPGTAVTPDETGPPARVAEADVLVTGPPDAGSALGDPQSAGTVPSEIRPPPKSPPPKSPPPKSPPPKSPPPKSPPEPHGADPTTPVPVDDALPAAAAAVPADHQRSPSWIRRHRLPVFALGCAALAAAITIPLISPSHPSSLRPSASSSPSATTRPVATGAGLVSLGNLSQTPSPVDVYLYPSGSSSPQFVQHDVAYGTILPYQPVNAGDYSVEVRAAGSSASSNPAWSVGLTVQAGGAYTVAPLRATAQRGQLKVIDDNLTTPKGKSFVRVIQADVNQGQVTFHCSCAAGAPGNITTDAAPGTVSPQVPIPPGTWTMSATGPTGTTSLPVTLTAGTVHTEIVISKPGGGLQIINLVDAVPSYRRVAVDLPSQWHNVLVPSVAFSPSGATLALVSSQICLWDISATRCSSIFGSPSAYSVAFSPDGKTLAVADTSAGTYLRNVATGSQSAPFIDPHSSGAYSVAFSPDGQTLAVGDGNGSTYLWNVATQKLTVTLPDPHGKGVSSVAFTRDGKMLAAGDHNGHAYLWDVATRNVVFTLGNSGGKDVMSVAFSPDDRLLVAGDDNGETYLWNVATGKLMTMLRNPGTTGVISVTCSSDDATMAAGDNNGRIYVWNVDTGRLLATLPDPNNAEINSVAFSSNGQVLASSDQSGGVFLWYRN